MASATNDHLDEIVAMTRTTRRQLASWSPVYFNPAAEADELHAGFLSFLVDFVDVTTQVVAADDQVIGFFVEIPQSTHVWVDDLCSLLRDF